MSLNILVAHGFEDESHPSVWATYHTLDARYAYDTMTPYTSGGRSLKSWDWNKHFKIDFTTTSQTVTMAFWSYTTSAHADFKIRFPEGDVIVSINDAGTDISVSAPGMTTVNVSGLNIHNAWHYFGIEVDAGNLRVLFDGDVIATGTTTATTPNSIIVWEGSNQNRWIDHLVVYTAPYAGELYLQPLRPQSDVSSTMDGREPNTAAADADVLGLPLDESTYVYSTGTNITKDSIVTMAADALPPELQALSIEAVAVFGVHAENVVSSDTAACGLSKNGTHYMGTAITLQTTSKMSRAFFAQNPETNAAWASITEVESFSLRTAHNHA